MLKKLAWVGLGATLGVVGLTGAAWYYLRDAMR